VSSDRIVRLNTQFRLPSVIAEFVGEYFYEGDYHSPMVRPVRISDLPQLLLLDTASYGQERREGSLPGGGKINNLEARLAVHLAVDLLHRGVAAADVGIIAPYRAQVALIEQLIEERLGTNPTERPKVSTVDAFQGAEKDIIIATCVRSNDNRKVGFVRELRRFNVTVTRSKGHLLVIGDFDHLENVDDEETQRFFRLLVAFVKRESEGHETLVRFSDAKEYLETL
jgi:superfamily I DNA and/or RNA helicase